MFWNYMEGVRMAWQDYFVLFHKHPPERSKNFIKEGKR